MHFVGLEGMQLLLQRLVSVVRYDLPLFIDQSNECFAGSDRFGYISYTARFGATQRPDIWCRPTHRIHTQRLHHIRKVIRISIVD